MIFNIGVKGTKETIEIDSGLIPDDISNYVYQKGLEALIGRGRTKLGKVADYKSVDAFVAEATAIAMKQYDEMKAGKTRMVGGTKKAKGADAAVQTEMLRIAKLYAKDQVRAAGNIKVSKVSAAEWTRAAKAYIEQDSEYFRKVAEANLSAAKEVKPTAEVDLSFIKEDPKAIARAKAAADKKASAKSAEAKGKTPPPAKKGKAQPHANH